MCLCTCVFCRCGPHLHWAPHIEVKWHPRTVARRWWRQLPLRHQQSRFGAYSTLQEYHMWVKHPHKHTCIHIHTSGHTRTLERPVRLFFHYWSLVWWVTLSWPLTNTFAHPQEIGQVIIHADRNIYIHICQLSRLAFWFFFFSQYNQVCTQVWTLKMKHLLLFSFTFLHFNPSQGLLEYHRNKNSGMPATFLKLVFLLLFFF